MKVIRRIVLLVVYPTLMLALGLWGGVTLERFFYPMRQESEPESEAAQETADMQSDAAEAPADALEDFGYGGAEDGTAWAALGYSTAEEAAAREETLCADTVYVLQENDLTAGTQVETTWDLPSQYIGMTREQFLMAMENYTNAPPLAEQERGFVSAEVIAYSRERVVVQKNYEPAALTNGYYITVQDHEVVVMLGDGESFYMNTGISYDDLPASVQTEVLQMLYLGDEEALYNFLESYSS